MAPLPPRPSWVTVTDLPEPPCGYGSPLAPWRPAGRKSLTQSQVFLNQAPLAPSRPSSAPSTAASARPSSGRSWSRPPSAPAEAERPHSAPVRPRSAPRRLQPPSRPSSAWQRPSSAPAGPRTNATNGVSVSWRGRRYRVRQTGDRSQLSQTSLDSMAGMASFSIYTDHGLSDDEDHQDHAPGVEGTEGAEDAPPPEADAASTEMAVAESEDSSISTGDAAAEVDAAAEAAKMWSGKATLGILQVTVAERPLYAELKMGGEAQSTSCVTGRWPSLAEKLTFELKDIRVEETLTLCFWTSVGEWRSRPRCVAHGKTTLTFDEKERQVKVTLDVHQNGQLLRGLAVLHLEVSGGTSETDIDHSDENCSRNLLLSRRFKGRRFRGIKERPVGPMDRVMDVNARCWSYLEHRSSFLKVRRQECHQRIRKAQALRAGPAANQGTPLSLSRISSEQAFRLQRFLRSFVKCGQHGGRELAKVTAEAFQASELRHFLQQTLQAPHLSEDDASALKSLLCEDGQVQMKTFLNFVEHGVTVVPPARVIYPDKQRARDILKEMFPGFLAKELQREMEFFDD